MLPYGSGIWGARGPESCDPAECSAESNIRKPKENHNRACEHSYCFRWRPSVCSEDVPGRKGNGTLKPEIRLGTKGVTRAVNTLGDLSDVGDRIGIYGVRIAGTSAGALEKRAGATTGHDNVRTSDVDPSTGSIGWAGHYYYPLEEDRSVEFCA